MLMYVAIILCNIQFLHAQHSKIDSLNKAVKKYEKQGSTVQKDTNYIITLNNLAAEYRYVKLENVRRLAKKSLKYSQAIDFKLGEGEALLHLGHYYSDKGKNSEAITFFQNAMSVAGLLKDKDLLINTHNTLAREYAYKGDYDKALNVYLLGIDLAEADNNLVRLSILNENVANLYADQKDFEQALNFYKKVIKINDEIGNEIYIAETMSNIASVYAEANQLEYAMFNINKSITTFEKKKILDWLAYAYEVKGKIYLKKNNYKWALHWYDQSELLHKKLDDERGKIDLYNGKAEALLNNKQDSLAQEYAIQALMISDKIKSTAGKVKCAQTLYNISKNKGDYENALCYHEMYQEAEASLMSSDNLKSLTMLKVKYAYDQQKQSLIEFNEERLQKQKAYVNITLLIVLILATISFIIYRGRRAEKKLNVELKSKKEALEIREVELKGLNNAKDKLFSIIGHDLRGPVGALQELVKLYLNGDLEEKEFLSYVPKLNEDISEVSFTLNNLLTWGQSQMNGMVTKPELGNLESIVADNVNLLSKIAENKSIRIINKVEENTIIHSDLNQIDIVIRNLISNALKFTPENGMIVIEAFSKSTFWQVCVRDTGVGMDEKTVQNIFKGENFTTEGTNHEKGTGLGLSLCKEMVENNKGSIWVDSIPRKGSSFFFTIPKGQKTLKKVV
jgi:signal transduction histidine kinase/tetratricopeptide (TPR) repeat protein